jgi:hypothetical protein
VKNKNELTVNVDKIHTTELGVVRIKSNIDLETNDVVNWCKREIKNANEIYKKGKNWYVSSKNCIITINAYSYTIITAHKK